MKKITYFIIIIFLIAPVLLRAQEVLDSDNDGLSDEEERTIYYTEVLNPDTDGDGYLDGEEIEHGYSPHFGNRTKLGSSDYDKDDLNDALEIAFGSSLNNKDSDGDGYPDGHEVKYGYSPVNPKPEKLPKKIEIKISTQRLSYHLGEVKLDEFLVSTGLQSMPTPLGNFKIDGKHPRAWSGMASLWMPWWMSFQYGKFGIHELPEWPGGHKEGEDHLGKRASHGCVRLGVGPAKFLYDWAPVGTPVVIIN